MDGENTKEIAKELAKRKIQQWLLGTLLSSAPLFLGLFTVFIAALFVLGLFESDGSSSNRDYAYIQSTYSNSDSLVINEKSVEINAYVAGVLDKNDALITNDEGKKAFSIVVRTYILKKTKGGEIAVTTLEENTNTEPTDNQVLPFNENPSQKSKDIAEETTGIVISSNGDLISIDINNTCSDVDAITCEENPSLEIINIETLNTLANEGNNAEEILIQTYEENIEVIDLNEISLGIENEESGSGYTGTYTNSKNGKTYRNYKQYLFSAENYKGGPLTDSQKNHLANVGCATNTSAIIISGDDKSVTPVSIYIEKNYQVGGYLTTYYPANRVASYEVCNQWDNGWCTSGNSNSQINNQTIKDTLINNLKNGGAAVLFINYEVEECTVNREKWTNSQHYFAALDYNSVDNTIYISNPGTSSSSQNGWISLDYFGCVHVAGLLYPEN